MKCFQHLQTSPDADNPAHLVHGGTGGRAGRHGVGGTGGAGGRGGWAHSWTTHSRYRSMNGVWHTRTHYHRNPGGVDGPPGRDGHTPSVPLMNGPDGQRGTVNFVTTNAFGQDCVYFNKYNLRCTHFRLYEFGHNPDGGSSANQSLITNMNPNGLQADGVFEFGQMCFLDNINIVNIGGMPTPPRQRQLITLNKGKWVKPVEADDVFSLVNDPLPASHKKDVAGNLRFQIGMMDVNTIQKTDHEPVAVSEPVILSCTQLGIETANKNGRNTGFKRVFGGFGDVTDDYRTLFAQFPAENRGGFMGLTSLASGEGTSLMFPVKNIASLPFGSTTGRGLGIQVSMPPGFKIKPEDIEFTFIGHKLQSGNVTDKEVGNNEGAVNTVKTDSGTGAGMLSDKTQIDLANKESFESNGIEKTEFEGYFFPVPFLPGNSVNNLKMEVKLKETIPPYAYGEIRAQMYIEDLYQKQWRLIQKRMTSLRCEPKFHPHNDIQAILLTTSSTTEKQYSTWMEILSHKFGLVTSVFSLSRYGSFGPKEIWMESNLLFKIAR
jgi:hypothetical protein